MTITSLAPATAQAYSMLPRTFRLVTLPAIRVTKTSSGIQLTPLTRIG